MVEFSERVQRLSPSATVQMADTAANIKRTGKSVVSLAAGEPHFNTPPQVASAAVAAINSGKTKYTPSDGMAELRDAIAKAHQATGHTTDMDNVIVSAGAKQVIFNAFASTLNRGDEVLVLAPFWISYRDIANFFGANVKVIQSSIDQAFEPDLELLRQAISPRTKWLVINSPNNPTGSVYSTQTLRAIADIVQKSPGVLLLTDEIYEHIVFDATTSVTFSQIAPELRQRTLIVNGFSKGYCMTGWRVGYGIGAKALIQQMSKVQSQSTTNASTISQYAALEALSGDRSFMQTHTDRYRALRDLACSILDTSSGLRFHRPNGAFYLFPDMSHLVGGSLNGTTISSDVEFCDVLLRQHGVAVVPGKAFGAPGFFRLSYACSEEELRKGCDRIAQAISQVQ